MAKNNTSRLMVVDRAELRAINREKAFSILYCIDHYLANHAGDVEKVLV